MNISILRRAKRSLRVLTRNLLSSLPTSLRFGLYRGMVDTQPVLPGLVLKIADSQEELEACFALLHDAYVASGFMRPHPSGLRVTAYHALPTTTTLCAKVGGTVVGTLSIVRDGVFGFPMQTAFDITSVRNKPGHIAEISALAIHSSHRKTGGTILFPLMKFMYEYCTKYFDTRHLLIAVNPNKIEMYESLLFFERLTAQAVDRYDFANGAPAVGATLDLHRAPDVFQRVYGSRAGRRNLYRYFVEEKLPAIQFPARPWHLSNDPVMTPSLLDYFFNQRVSVLVGLDQRKLRLLHSVYTAAAWQSVLPPLAAVSEKSASIRLHPRFTLTCPATLTMPGELDVLPATIIEISRSGFLARAGTSMRPGASCEVRAELGTGVRSSVTARVARNAGSDDEGLLGFNIESPDEAWLQCVDWLDSETQRATKKSLR